MCHSSLTMEEQGVFSYLIAELQQLVDRVRKSFSASSLTGGWYGFTNPMSERSATKRSFLLVREGRMKGDVFKVLVPLGQILATPGALEALEERNLRPDHYLARHAIGDWGDVCEEDARLNDQALKNGERISSAYRLDDSEKIWIITEADRSATTLLLPEEY